MPALSYHPSTMSIADSDDSESQRAVTASVLRTVHDPGSGRQDELPASDACTMSTSDSDDSESQPTAVDGAITAAVRDPEQGDEAHQECEASPGVQAAASLAGALGDDSVAVKLTGAIGDGGRESAAADGLLLEELAGADAAAVYRSEPAAALATLQGQKEATTQPERSESGSSITVQEQEKRPGNDAGTMSIADSVDSESQPASVGKDGAVTAAVRDPERGDEARQESEASPGVQAAASLEGPRGRALTSGGDDAVAVVATSDDLAK